MEKMEIGKNVNVHCFDLPIAQKQAKLLFVPVSVLHPQTTSIGTILTMVLLWEMWSGTRLLHNK